MSNRLAALAADIRTAHEDVCKSAKYSAERAVDAGRVLLEAKGDTGIPRGGWRRWVEEVAGVPYDTSQRYVQLFVAVSEQSVSIQDIAEAGQLGAPPPARHRLVSRMDCPTLSYDRLFDDARQPDA